MVVLLDGESLEASLPDVSAELVVAMIAADMRSHQPLHPAAQVAIFVRMQHQMEVIGHHTEANQSHRQPIISFTDQPQSSWAMQTAGPSARDDIIVLRHLLDDDC